MRDDGESKVVAYVVIDNLLDKDPGIIPSILDSIGGRPGSAVGVTQNPFDPIGRYFKAGVRASF